MTAHGPAARLAEALMSYAQDLTTSGGHYQAARAAARALLARLEEIEPALKTDSLCTCGHASDAHLLPSQQMYCAVDDCPCMHYKEERCEGSGAGSLGIGGNIAPSGSVPTDTAPTVSPSASDAAPAAESGPETSAPAAAPLCPECHGDGMVQVHRQESDVANSGTWHTCVGCLGAGREPNKETT